MIRRDRPRRQALPSAELRRMRTTAAQDEPGAIGGEETGSRSVERTSHRRVSVKRVAVTGILLFAAAVVVGGVLLWQRVSAFNANVSSAPMLSSTLFGPLGGKERVNVLLIGYAGEAKHGGTYLADSLNILSIDPVMDTTTLIPIPRDLWIQGVPELPRGGKANEVFALGWRRGGDVEAGRAESAVITKITGLKIDHWLAIDFQGFARLVDAVGGVDVVNPRAFKYTWSEENYAAHKWTGGSFARGHLHLNGARALDYGRNRYTSVPAESSDFARSVRQQRILEDLRIKLGAGFGSLGPALAAMNALKDGMRTDLSAIDLILLGGHLHADRRVELSEGKVLQAGRNDQGSYILFPAGAKRLGDYGALRAFIASALEKPIATPRPSPTPTS